MVRDARRRLPAAVLVALGAAMALAGCDKLFNVDPHDCSPRICDTFTGVCRCNSTSTQGNHACSGPDNVMKSGGVSLGGNCFTNGGWAEYCKAGLTCIIDGSNGRSSGVCEANYGRCPLAQSAP